MKELIIVKGKELFEEVKKRITTDKPVNTDFQKVMENEKNVILLHRGMLTGHNFFQQATSVYLVGFEEEFFKTPEYEQLKSRFNRITPVIL